MSGLCTDLYEIRMALSYLRRGMTEDATFSLFARKLPPHRGFLVAAGRGARGADGVLFFLEGEHARGHVLYHRYDGHYGLLSPAR